MRLISVNDIQSGMVLGRSVYGYNNKLLLSAGFKLTTDFKLKLSDRGYTHVYIMEEGTEDIIPEDIISDEIKFQARAQLEYSAEQIQDQLKIKDLNKAKVYDALKNGHFRHVNLTRDMLTIVGEIIEDISHAGATMLISPLFKSRDTYYHDHAINTTTLAVLIGRKYGLNRADLLNLAAGCFLHDFGKLVIDKMKGESRAAADELMREHPTFGYLLIRNTKDASPMICQIVNQHHEHQDGAGFPIGLNGENLPPITSVKRNTRGTIYRLAEICSVADAYDKGVMNPHDDSPLSPLESIKNLILGAGTVYNRHIVNTLVDIVPAYPVGAWVKITKFVDNTIIGWQGVVAKIHEEELNRPSIILLYDRHHTRIKPRLIETAKYKSIELELIL